jgi:hypothetical protein
MVTETCHLVPERISFGYKAFDCLYRGERQPVCLLVGKEGVRLSVGGLIAHELFLFLRGLH